jgi:hypothetical protein
MRRFTFLIVLALSASVAHAQKSAREEFTAGTQAYDQGHFREAAVHFAAGYRLEPEPALLFNEAQAWRREYERAGDRAAGTRGAELYRRYIDLPQLSDAERAEATVYLRTLDERLSAPVVAALPPPPPPEPPRRRTALWVGLGVGAAVLAVGLGVGLGVGLTQGSSQAPTVMPKWQ